MLENTGILQAHAAAREAGKPPYFFSRFNFERMKDAGNTHFCFYCGGKHGYRLGPNGEIENSSDGEVGKGGNNPMDHHDPKAHADAVVANADKYSDVDEWLKNEVSSDFPFMVART